MLEEAADDFEHAADVRTRRWLLSRYHARRRCHFHFYSRTGQQDYFRSLLANTHITDGKRHATLMHIPAHHMGVIVAFVRLDGY